MLNRSQMAALAAVGGICLSACGGGGGGGSTSESPSAGAQSQSVPKSSDSAAKPFQNATPGSNIAFRVGITNYPVSRVAESTFGGVATGDCDGDNDLDLFVTYGDSGGDGGGPNRLYLNRIDTGNPLLFSDVADEAGVANTRADGAGNDRHSGPSFADMDGDGDLDLFVGGIYGDPTYIYENTGDCAFVDATAGSPGIRAMRAEHTISAAFGDYDLDGDLDMFLTHWGTADVTYEGTNPFESEHLWRNDSDATGIRFTNVSAESGVTDILWATRTYESESPQIEDYTFAPMFARINADAWPDLVVTGDFGTTQALINGRDGTFWNATDEDVRAAQWGMGSALADIDDDGDLDWFVTSIMGPRQGDVVPHGNRLYRNDFGLESSRWFTDITADSGTADGEWGWGACFLDIDNDGDLDIFQTNGWDFDPPEVHGHDYSHDASRLFRNDGQGRFTEKALEFGLDDTFDSRAAVCADLDEDGDLEILEITDDAPNSAKLWENLTAASARNFLRVRLEGLAPNTQAAGARIFVTAAGKTQMREVRVGSDFIAQQPAEKVFGLGAATTVERIRVVWPAVIESPGQAPVQQVTLIEPPDPRLAPSAARTTLVIRHPAR